VGRIAGDNRDLAGFENLVQGSELVIIDDWICQIDHYRKPEHNNDQLKGALFVENSMDRGRFQRICPENDWLAARYRLNYPG
jgi:hypothetical protein